jgi:hypothetical protein
MFTKASSKLIINDRQNPIVIIKQIHASMYINVGLPGILLPFAHWISVSDTFDIKYYNIIEIKFVM